MEITYVVIVSVVTYFLGAITKLFIESIPDRYILNLEKYFHLNSMHLDIMDTITIVHLFPIMKNFIFGMVGGYLREIVLYFIPRKNL